MGYILWLYISWKTFFKHAPVIDFLHNVLSKLKIKEYKGMISLCYIFPYQSVFENCFLTDVTKGYDMRYNLWEICARWRAHSGLCNLNLAQISCKVGRADVGNEFSNTLWNYNLFYYNEYQGFCPQVNKASAIKLDNDRPLSYHFLIMNSSRSRWSLSADIK